MKFSKMSQLALVSTLGLLAASLLSGCLLVTVDYVFVANSSSTTPGSTGEIQTFAVDSQSGAIRPVTSATISSGGSSPVAMAVTGDYANLYVANQGNDTIVHFLVNDNGTLTAKETVTVPFQPTALAVNTAGSNASGTYLFVVGGATSAQLAEYPLSSGVIGSAAVSMPLTITAYPTDSTTATGVNVLASNGALYVTVYDKSAYNPGGAVTSSANPGWLFGFTIGTSGSLTPTANSPYQAGVKPTALASDPTNRFLYLTDYASNELIGYNIQSGDVPSFMYGGPFKTGSEPTAVLVDPRGLYIYVANALSSNISAYTIALASGIPSSISSATGSNTLGADTEPVAITLEPSEGRYVYTANYLGNSISGFHLDPNTGAVNYTQATPYPTGSYPTAIVSVPHGNHAVQSVTP